jgi:hypothetical protein
MRGNGIAADAGEPGLSTCADEVLAQLGVTLVAAVLAIGLASMLYGVLEVAAAIEVKNLPKRFRRAHGATRHGRKRQVAQPDRLSEGIGPAVAADPQRSGELRSLERHCGPEDEPGSRVGGGGGGGWTGGIVAVSVVADGAGG